MSLLPNQTKQGWMAHDKKEQTPQHWNELDNYNPSVFWMLPIVITRRKKPTSGISNWKCGCSRCNKKATVWEYQEE